MPGQGKIEGMSESIDPSTLPDFDMAHHLDTPEAMAAYLTVVMEEGDDASMVDALRTMARASRTPDLLALVAEMNAAQQVGAPLSFETVTRACAALRLRSIVQPI